jgi:hypothetical protein
MVVRIVTAALVVAVLGVAGCTSTSGSGSSAKFTGAQGAVAQVVADLQKAGERKDATKICTQILSRRLVDQLSQAGTSCGQEMKQAIDNADDFKLDVQRVTVNGSNATAVVRRGSDGPTSTFRFVREDGTWKATDFGTSRA